MANYTVYGYIKDKNCSPIIGANVYPYFKKIDSGSPDSKWSDTPYTTDGDGYYSFNLGDNALLGSEASFKKGTDKIYISVVSDGEDLVSLTMSSCLFISHTTTSNDSNELNLDAIERRSPIIDSYTFPNATRTNTQYSMSESSYADTSWTSDGCYGTLISEKFTYDSIDIFDGHQLIDTIYSWDETSDRSIQNNSNDQYSFSVAGIYNLKIEVFEKWNTSTFVESQVTIKYNIPDTDFFWTPIKTNSWQGDRLKGQEEITFHNNTFDIDGRYSTEYTYEWTINDKNQDGSDNSVVYSSKDFNYTPTHKFQSKGIKNITLKCYWNDGFDDLVETISHSLEIFPFDIVVDFSWTPEVPQNRGQNVSFNPDISSGDTDRIEKYDWTIEDMYPKTVSGKYTFLDSEQSIFGDGSVDNNIDVDNTTEFTDTKYPEIHFHNSEQKDAVLVITYSNGWVSDAKQLLKNITFEEYHLDADITLSKQIAESRLDEISISNSTIDTLNLQYYVDWKINDYFSKYNPLNSQYGLDILDNTIEINGNPPGDAVLHQFQSNVNHNIDLKIYYDNGWQMVNDSESSIIGTSKYSLSSDFETSPIPIDNGFKGKNPVTYINSTQDQRSLSISVSWEWVDESGIDQSTFTESRIDRDPSENEIYTYQYPSREPYSSTILNVTKNKNKKVTMSLRYDNGWDDNIIDSTIKYFEASPNEINGSITHECNIDLYSH